MVMDNRRRDMLIDGLLNHLTIQHNDHLVNTAVSVASNLSIMSKLLKTMSTFDEDRKTKKVGKRVVREV